MYVRCELAAAIPSGKVGQWFAFHRFGHCNSEEGADARSSKEGGRNFGRGVFTFCNLNCFLLRVSIFFHIIFYFVVI